jgi:hypothetical protein
VLLLSGWLIFAGRTVAAESSVAGPDVATRVVLGKIRTLALAKEELTVRGMAAVLGVQWSRHCGRLDGALHMVRWCNYTPVAAQRGALRLIDFGSAGLDAFPARGGTLRWSIEPTLACVSTADMAAAFGVPPAKGRRMPIADFPPGGEVDYPIPQIVDFVLLARAEEDVYIEAELWQGCAAKISLFRSEPAEYRRIHRFVR